MHSKRIRLGLSACALCLVLVSAAAGLTPPPPLAQPTPVGTPVQAPTPPSVNADESLPVLINYGQGQETRVSIYRGMMEPVGLHPNQAVTVTVSFPARWAGAPVKLGLYDGGQAGPAAPPGQDIIYISNPGVPIPNVSVSGTLQFDFQAGSILGLYRVLLTVGSEQYLLSFYAGRPQALPTPTPVPTPNLVPRDN